MNIKQQLLATGYEITKFFPRQTHGQVITVKEMFGGAKRAIKLFDVEGDTTVLMELDIMSRLRHPHIMSNLKLLTLIDYIGLVMPLAQHTINEARASSNKKLSWFYKIATAIEFMHSNNILHLDIKYPNIVILDDEPKLIDFGCSMFVDDIVTGEYQPSALVAMMYRAPEIFNGCRQYTASIDVWAFGILMLSLLAMDIVAPEDTSCQSYYVWLVDKFSNAKYINKQLRAIPDSHQTIFSNIIADILRVDSKQRPTMKQICEHTSFDTIRTSVVGIVRDVTYSTVYRDDHSNLVKEFIKWVHEQHLLTKTQAIFLAIDIFHRVAEDYRYDLTLSSQVLLVALYMSCKLIDEPAVKYTSQMNNSTIREIEFAILHKLDGVIYHSPYYDKALTGDELLLVINEILYDPLLYTTNDIQRWYYNKRLEVSVPKYPNKDITIVELLSKAS